jgi:hypothetical protein
MIEIAPERLQRFLSEDFHLRNGIGKGINSHVDVCAMQAVAWLAGRTDFTDAPDCASPVITRYVVKLNDSSLFAGHRDELKPFLPRIVGSRTTGDVEVKRGFIAADYAVRVFAPIRLRIDGKRDWAEELESLPAIVDGNSAIHARNATAKIRKDAYADASAAAYADASADADAYAAAAADAYAAAYADASADADAYAAAAADAYAAADADAYASADADAYAAALRSKALECLDAMISAS